MKTEASPARCVVTGGGSGIDRATALAFARAGVRVVVADVGEQGNQETSHLIEQQGGHALALRSNVTQTDDVKAALEKTFETFGRLDFAFNNAGVEQQSRPRPISPRKNGTESSTCDLSGYP